MKYRIWLDQDNTIYDLATPWYGAHNRDYPQHDLQPEHIKGWDTQAVCNSVGCSADIYSYFNDVSLWRDGKVIDGAKEVVDTWYSEGIADLGINTTASNTLSMPYKVEWIQHYFPYITDILINYKSHIKHLLRGDILIDDGIHNLEHYKGIRILYTQPWNEENKTLLRANNWTEVDTLVRDSIELLDCDYDYTHQDIEALLKRRYSKGVK